MLVAVLVLSVGISAVDVSPASATAAAKVMVTTQRMSEPRLTSTQNGWYGVNSTLTLVCHLRGQAVQGYFSPYLPNGGWDDLWYLVDDGYFVADVDIDTGSNNPVVPVCPLSFTSSPVPVVTGTVRVDETLTASVGAWNPSANLSYQWKLNGAAVSGATASTWRVTAGAAGAAVTVTVTATRIGYATVARTSIPATVAYGVITGATPTAQGLPSVGKTLTGQPGSWGPTPVTLTYAWLRDGTVIAGQTGATYVPTATDVGKGIAFRVTATKAGYTSLSKTSAARIIGYPFTAAPTPTISGTGRVGQQLTANAGAWSPTPASLAYQWYRNGQAIAGATASTYTLVSADALTPVTVRVTATKPTYTTTTATSAAKSIEGVLSAATPKISGTPTVGQTLSAAAGTWGPAPVALTYQWLRDGAAIAGATAATYVLVTTDADKLVSVRVTGAKAGYTTTSLTSSGLRVGRAFTASPTPTISGTAKQGQTLTAVPGAWGPAPVTLAYQWYRGSTAITGATGTQYVAALADVGQSITVRVTGSKTGYTTVVQTSAAVIPLGLALTAGTPSISGEAKAGHTLTAVTGTWSPVPVAFAYQWHVNGGAVAGATGPTWVVPVWAATRSVTVSVTGSKVGYPTVTKTSAAVGISHVVGSSVGPGSSMPPGSQLTSNNGTYVFAAQTDGNLVIYKSGTPIWASNTAGNPPREFAIQGDGNLVAYRTDGRAYWASNTNGKAISTLVMQDDGNLVLYAPGGAAVWATNTSQGAGGVPGVGGWAYPIRPHATLTTYAGHNGDDFPVGVGTPVYSMGAGVVSFSTYAVTSAWCPVAGAIGTQQTDLRVSTNRDGHTYLITYAHMNSYVVGSGQTVQAGQLIGYSGAKGCATGAHLHIDIKVDGVAKVLYPRNIFGTSY